MYYPIQIPYVLNKTFAESIKYSEEIVSELEDFVICLWDMQPLSKKKKTVQNIIVADGCIDLVVDFDMKTIGYAGMSKTNFNYKINLPVHSMGARFKPGAFYEITSIPANRAMDNFLPIDNIDKNFDKGQFFSLNVSDAKMVFKNYINSLIESKNSGKYINFFDELNENTSNSANDIYKKLHYSHRQCQRLFLKNYGLSPQMVLCILRFQWCLKNLILEKKCQREILDKSNYYDQAHFIHDFKKNIGLTPLELIRKYT